MTSVQVTFQTITPLWTGDAWQDNREIRPSSLVGSLRFWFEVIYYFSGICKKDDFNKKLGRFEKEVNREKLKECLAKKGNTFEAKIECLLEQGIPLPSIIFGTTNWRSLIEIKSIEYLEDYCFGNRLNLPVKICVSKSNYEIKENYDCPKKSNKDWSVFYFTKPYFYGKFEVKFQIEEKILKPIFYPLLTFMDKYGFWGGKWNIGYGRLKVLEVKVDNKTINNWNKSDFELFDNSCFSWETLIKSEKLDFNYKSFKFLKTVVKKKNFYCKTQRNLGNKISNIPKKIVFIELPYSGNKDYKTIIETLLKDKVKIRNCLRPNNNNNEVWTKFRHKLLGEKGEGSKILPFIYEEQEQLKCSFLSIDGLLNLEGGSNE